MINISLTGKIFNNGSLHISDDVAYKVFFIKSDGSPVVISDKRKSEIGYYNINLGDPDLLNQQGIISIGDKVIVAVWSPYTKEMNDITISEWSFIEHIIDERDTYIQDIQIKSPSNPECLFNITGGVVGEETKITDIGSNDNKQWLFSGGNHYQKYTHDGIELFKANDINIVNNIVISWGDTTSYNGSFIEGEFSHIYNDAITYNPSISLTNSSGLSCNNSFVINCIYKIYNGLTWNEPIIKNTLTVFTPTITGSTDRISSVEYYVNGQLISTKTNWYENFEFVFPVTGNYTVNQLIRYNDGYNDIVISENYFIKMRSIASFTSNTSECGLIFVDNSDIASDPVTKYQWDVTDGILVLSHVEGTEYDTWSYSWPYRGIFRVRLAVTDSNGYTSSYTREYTVSDCPNSSGGGGGGGGSPWIYQEYRDIPLPTVKVNFIIDDDTNKEIKILSVF